MLLVYCGLYIEVLLFLWFVSYVLFDLIVCLLIVVLFGVLFGLFGFVLLFADSYLWLLYLLITCVFRLNLLFSCLPWCLRFSLQWVCY